MTDDSEDDSDETDVEDEEEYETDSGEDEDDNSHEVPDKLDNGESDPANGRRFQGNREMHVLFNSVTICRLGRMIANLQQANAETLARDIERGSSTTEVKARYVGQLRNAASNARASWAREMQSELEVAEQYRVAMIQVLQEEIRC
ncbi:uncharacterized protein LTHEOB_5915 [Neofusicoccum parvum]|uniref:Uncharacterized protein LTHEOB_5915 n=1 Tax=Neofusicoccum parvum TaxID=310453 RepID=A0ACB5SF11_9PEZI|nr:uncharacterized protein LTHEOB_5915 [Neofusicoccum parvum]GME65009.1 uncharacterized protein LTHEOB_5915 [Neofusicoccum parvum]